MNSKFMEIFREKSIAESEKSYDNNESTQQNSDSDSRNYSYYQNFQHFLKKDSRIIRASDISSVFTYGNCKDPIEHLADARFNEVIEKKLRYKGFYHAFPIQAYSWKEISEGRAVTIVNPKCSGKTLAYLPALLTLLVDVNIEEDENSQGPIGIIFASSSREIDLIYEDIRWLTPTGFSAIKAYGKWSCDETKLKLLNGCHLLITTPPCFLRLATTTDCIQFFDRTRIMHLVFHNFDSIMGKFEDDVVRKSIGLLTYGNDRRAENPQIIVTATKWLKNNEKMLQLSCDPLVIIGNNIEAAYFAKSRFRVSRTSTDTKREHLLNHLMTRDYCKKKTVVFVSNELELNSLEELCNKHSFQYVRLSRSDQKNKDEIWRESMNGRFSVVLATDESMLYYRLKKAQIIIHYTLPAKWSTFSKRFEASFEYYKSFIVDRGDKQKEPFVDIMMDENNIPEMAQIISFLTDHRLINDVPKEISAIIDQINANIERSKIDLNENNEPVDICSRIMAFGGCNIFKCSKRHALISELDQPKYLPSFGKIKFTLLASKSPIHFVIKINEISLSDNVWTSWNDRNEEIEQNSSNIQAYFKDSEKKIVEANAKVGDLCCYFHPSDIKWYRVKLLSKGVQDENHPLKPIQVLILLIDKGDTRKVKATDLMKLPSAFKLFPPLVYELRIVNFVPYDNDYQFDMHTVSKVESILTKKITKNSINVAAIDFSIQDTAYSSTFHSLKYLRKTNAWAYKFDLKKCLLDMEYAVYNKEVHVRLKKLIKNADFNDAMKKIENNVMPKSEVSPAKMEQKIEPPKMQLKHNQFYNVMLTHFKSPDEFYIQILGVTLTENRLKHLEDPFLTLKCKLSAIKPRFDQKIWDERFSLGIKNYLNILSKKREFKMKLVKEVTQNYYEVTLYAIENMKNVAKMIVEESLADAIESNESKAEKKLMKMLKDSAENFQILPNYLLHSLGFPKSSKFITHELNDPVKRTSTHQKLESIVKSQDEVQIAALSPVYQHPSIEWYQQNGLVCLEVDCLGALSYSLEIDEWSVSISVEYENNMEKVAKIKLYALIHPEYSHTKNDRTINIRLVKLSPENVWPRLAFSTERNNFIKYCSEKSIISKPAIKTNMIKPFIRLVPADLIDDDYCEDQKLNFIDELENPEML